MSRTSEGAVLTRRHRVRQLAVRAATIRDLRTLWPLWNAAEIASYGQFVNLAALLIRARHQESAALAGQYFQAFRLIEGVGGTAVPRLAEQLPMSEIEGSLRATGLSGTLRALRAGFSPRAASRAGFTQAAGSAGRLALKGGRDTVVGSVGSDRRALGWQRVVDADPCHFCAMVASRGPVFKSRATAGFQAHDHDACSAEPLYEGSEPLARNAELTELWDRVTAGLSGREARLAFRHAIEDRQ